MRQAPFQEQIEDGRRRLADALARIRLIQEISVSGGSLEREALAFQWQCAAWAAIELAQAWVFEKRLGMPKRESENFDLLVKQGMIELETGRKLKQATEFRNLAARDVQKIDWAYLSRARVAELETLQAWAELAPELAEK